MLLICGVSGVYIRVLQNSSGVGVEFRKRIYRAHMRFSWT